MAPTIGFIMGLLCGLKVRERSGFNQRSVISLYCCFEIIVGLRNPYVDMILADGITLLCNDLQVDPQDIVMVGCKMGYKFCATGSMGFKNNLPSKRNCGTIDCMEEAGSGAVATIENKKVSVGTVDRVRRHGVGQYLSQEVEELKNQSVVYVGVDGTLAGLIYVEDQIREDARHVGSLHKQGVSIYMLSGDKRSTTEYVASKVGIPREKEVDLGKSIQLVSCSITKSLTIFGSKVLSHAKAAKLYHEHF